MKKKIAKDMEKDNKRENSSNENKRNYYYF